MIKTLQQKTFTIKKFQVPFTTSTSEDSLMEIPQGPISISYMSRVLTRG